MCVCVILVLARLLVDCWTLLTARRVRLVSRLFEALVQTAITFALLRKFDRVKTEQYRFWLLWTPRNRCDDTLLFSVVA